MWQTIEYKSAAIEQFRKGDLLQRVIDDVASEAANAAEMKAAASGNPLILMQVQLAADLRKLEALYSQHQRGQHRMRDRLKWLGSTDSRLAREETLYAENIRRRDSHTRTVTEKGKEKILVELRADGKTFTAKDSDKIKDRLLDGVKEVTRDSSAKVLFGSYRGFEVYVERAAKRLSGKDGFQLSLLGAGEREFRPGNLFYDFDEKFSLGGLFQRIDNFLAKGLGDVVEAQRENARQEKAELETVKSALGQEFPQQEELALVRENHGAIIRELQRMQDDANYVSTWTPKTSLTEETSIMANSAEQKQESGNTTTNSAKPREKRIHKLKFGNDREKAEYTVSNQHNSYIMDSYRLHRSYFSGNAGSPALSFYEDGRWYLSALQAPHGVRIRQFSTVEEAMRVARSDAMQHGFEEIRMQNERGSASTWEPKTSLSDEQTTAAEMPPKEERGTEDRIAAAPPAAPPEEQYHKIKYGEGEGRTEYLVTNQHNGHTLKNGYVVRRTYFNNHVGSLGGSLYEDGKWHSTATAPRGVKLLLFASQEAGIAAAREDAARRGLRETPTQPAEAAVPGSTLDNQICRERLVKAGFHPTNNDFYGKNEHELRVDTGDGGIFQMRVFQAPENQIGLRVQYEKYNMINGSRTVNAQFDTLDEALEFAGSYQKPAERPTASATREAAPAGYVRGMVFSRPRMR